MDKRGLYKFGVALLIFFAVSAFSFLFFLPFLSSQAGLQNPDNISISILNPKSFPTVGGEWKVDFVTTGKANLTIKAINGTHFSKNVKFISLGCGNQTVPVRWVNNDTLFVQNYSCNSTSTEISKELTSGNHTLEFIFGNQIAYAHNFAQRLNWVVQSGETTMTGATTTVNLGTEVNTSHAFILLSRRASTSYDDPDKSGIYATFVNGTQFTLNQYNPSTYGAVVDWEVIEGGSISVQSGVQAYTTTDTNFTIPINPVNTSRTAVFMNFGSCSVSTLSAEDQIFWTGNLTNSTNLYIQRDSSGNCAGSVSYYVVEFNDGSTVQKGQVPNVGTSILVNYPTPVNLSDTWLYFSGAYTNGALRDTGTAILPINSTTFQLNRYSNSANNARIQWYAISTPKANMQYGVTDMSSNNNQNITINSVVTNRSFVVNSFNDSGGGTTYANSMGTARIVAPTILNLQRGTTSQTNIQTWQVVQMPYNPPYVVWNESSLNLGTQPIGSGNLTGTAQIYSFLANNDTQISCSSGNCSYISTNFTSVNLSDTNYENVYFICSNNTIGNLSANFSVTSAQDVSPNYITVSCGFFDNIPPTGYLISPANDTYTNQVSQNLTAEAFDNYNLSSATLKVYNSSGNLVNSVTQAISGRNSTFGTIYDFPYDGVFKWSYQLNDTSQNTNTTENYTIIIDTTNPSIVYATGVAANDTNTTHTYVHVNVSVFDLNFANITYKLYSNGNPVNITTYNSPVSSINWTGLSDGVYYYNVTAYDLAGNKNSTVTRQIRIDTTPPVIDIIAPRPIQYLTNISLPLNVSVTDSGVGPSKCEWNLDNNPNQSIPCNQNTTFNTSVGAHTLYFYANDTLGNLAEANVTFEVSAGGVAIALNTPADNSYLNYNKSINFSFVAKSSLPINQCELYGNWTGVWKPNQTLYNLQNWTQYSFFVNLSSDGSYIWNVWCNDTSGASNFNLVNNTFTIDTVNPLVSFSSETLPNNSFVNATSIFVGANVTEPNFANITFDLFGSSKNPLYSDTFTGSTRTDTWLYLPNGIYYYNITVYDLAGNFNSTETRKVTLDTIPPYVNIVNPRNTSYNNATVSFDFNAKDINLGSCWYTINGGVTNISLPSCQNSSVSSPQGETTLILYANDSAGNFNSTNISYYVDSIAPDISYSSGTASNNTQFQRSWVFVNTTAYDLNFANITFDIYNSSGLVNQTTYNGNNITYINFTGLPSGDVYYYYNVTAQDYYGNKNSTSTRTIELIDTIPPHIQISTPKNETYNSNTNLPLTFSASDLNLDSCWYNLDNTANISIQCNQGTSFSTSDFSEHTLYLYANDTAGNVGSDNVSFYVNTSYIPKGGYEVQRGIVGVSSSTAVPISQVDPFHSFILLDTVSSSSAPNVLQVTANFTDSSDIELHNYAGTANTQWEIISAPDINTQRGQQTYTTTTNSITIPISAVNLSSSFIIVYNRLNTGTTNQYLYGLWNASFVNSTAIVLQRGTTGASGEVSWQVVNWNGVDVQNGTTAMTGTSAASNLTNPVQTNTSFLIFSGSISGSSTGLEYWNVRGQRNTTSVQFSRVASSGTYTADWFVISDPLLFSVNNGTTTVTASTSVSIPTLSNLTRSFSWQSHDSTGGGNTNANAMISNELTGTTTLALNKGTTSQTNVVNWEVIEMVDRVPPNGTLLSPANNTYTSKSSQNLTLNATDNMQLGNATLNVYNSSGSLINTTTILLSGTKAVVGVVYNFLYDGIFNWFYRIYDAAGNVFNTANNTITIDTTPPNISFSSGTLANYTLISHNWTFVNVSVSDVNPANLTFYLYNKTSGNLVNQTFYSGYSPTNVNWTNLPDGIYDYNVTAYDLAGNENSTETRIIRLDTTPPKVKILYPLNTTYNVNVTELNYSYYDMNPAFCWYSNNSGVVNSSAVPAGTNFTNVNTTQGVNALTLYCNDSLGHMNSSLITFFKDTIPPKISFSSGTASNNTLTSRSWIYANVSVTEAHPANMTYSLYNETSGNLVNKTVYYNIVNSINWTNLTSGAYYYNVSIYDFADNYNFTGTRKIILDTIPPNGTLINPANNTYTNNATQNFTANLTDNYNLSNATLNVYNSSGSLINTTTILLSGTKAVVGVVYNFLYDGIFNWFYRIYDAAGNVFNTANNTITIDTTPPNIKFVSPTNLNDSYFNRNYILANVSANDTNLANVTTYLYNALGLVKKFTNLTSLTFNNFSSLPDGVYYMNATATDLAGNKNSTETRTLYIDTIPPTISLNYPSNNYYLNSQSINFSSYVSDNVKVSNVSVYLDNILNQTNSSEVNDSNYTFLIKGVSFGAHTWKIESCDFAGNCINSSSRTFTVDLTNPESYLVAPKNNSYLNYDSVNFISNETDNTLLANSTLYIWYPNGTLLSNSNTANVSGTSNQTNYSYAFSKDGKYYWNSLTKDKAGNSAFNSSNYTLTIDTKSPNINFVYPTPLNDSYLNESYIEVNVSASDTNFANTTIYLYNSSKIFNESFSSSSQNFFHNFTSLPDGVYYVNATSLDLAGNKNSTETIMITLDTVAPNASLLSPANNTYSNNATQNFTLSANDTVGLGHAILNIYNSTGNLINATTILLSGKNAIVGVVYNFLYDGVFNWFYRVYDAAGNFVNTANRTITIDTTPPKVFLELPLNGTLTSDKVIYFSSSFSDINNVSNATLYLWNFTGNVINETSVSLSGTSNSTNISVSLPYYGDFKWNYLSCDSLGNCGFNLTNRTFSYEPQKLGLSLIYPPGNLTVAQDRLFNFTLNVSCISGVCGPANVSLYEQNSTVTQLVSSQNGTLPFYTNGSNPYTTSSLLKGQNQIVSFWVNSTGTGITTFFASANLTNNLSVSNLTKSWNVTIDNIPPNITIVSPLNKTYNVSNVDFNVSSNEALSMCNFTLDNWTTNYTLSEFNSTYFYNQGFHIGDGFYTAKFWCEDLVGNVNNTQKVSFIVDVFGANASLVSPGNNTYSNNATQNLTFSANDSVNMKNATLSVYNSSGSLINTTTILLSGTKAVAGVVYEFLYDGVFKWFYRIYDVGGHLSATQNNTITIDTTAPSINFGTGTSANDTNISHNWVYANVSVSDVNPANLTFYLYNKTSGNLVNQTFYSGYSPTNVNWTNLPDGIYDYNVTAYDLAGNENSTETRIIRLDTKAPYLKLDFPVNNTYGYNITSLNYTAYDAGVGLKSCWYNINGGANTSVACGQNISTFLTDGTYKWNMYANDTLGHLAYKNVTFTINTNFPAVKIFYPVNMTYNYNVTQLNFSATGVGLNSCWYSTDGGVTNHTTSCTQNITGLSSSQGSNHWTVYANNTAGTSYDSVYFSVDTIPPKIKIISPLNKTYYPSSLDFNVSSNEVVSTCLFSLNDFITNYTMNPVNSTYLTYTFPFINPGDYTAKFYCNDTVGNVNNTQSVSFASSYPTVLLNVTQPPSNTGILKYNDFNLSVNVTCAVSDCGPINVTLGSNNGTVSTITGTVPFYALKNPITTLSLNSSESEVINFTVNLTGSFGIYDFFAFGNLTKNEIISNSSNHINISIAGRAPPVINLTYPLNNYNFSGYSVPEFSFTVNDGNYSTCQLWGNWSGGWALNQTLNSVQPNVTTSFSGINTSNDGYYRWNVLCLDGIGDSGWSASNYTFSAFLPPAPAVLGNVTQTNDYGTGNVTISWKPTNHTTMYYIYAGDNLSNLTYLNKTTETNYTDTNFKGNIRKFYQIVSVNPGSRNYSVEYFGAHVYTLHHSANTNNWIAFPTNFSYLKDANQTLSDIPNATSFNMWNATIQQKVTCNGFSCPDFPACTNTNCNFNLKQGEGYEVNVNLTSPTEFNWSGVGIVYNKTNVTLIKNSTSFAENWISMWAGTGIKNAKDLLSGISNSDAVSKWNSTLQTSQGYLDVPGFGYLGTNFPVKMEEGYEVSVIGTENWTQI